jgi:hypothetical protein
MWVNTSAQPSPLADSVNRNRSAPNVQPIRCGGSSSVISPCCPPSSNSARSASVQSAAAGIQRRSSAGSLTARHTRST